MRLRFLLLTLSFFSLAAAPVPEEAEVPAEAETEAETEAEPETGPDPEAEAPAEAADATTGPRYSADLSDEELRLRWERDPAELGPISVGLADAGRLINGVQFAGDGPWEVTDPSRAYGTAEVVAAVQRAIREVEARFPGSPAIHVNRLSGPDGGYLRPHKSHQTGRDVDLGFYYTVPGPVAAVQREKLLDKDRCWALLRALVSTGDVQVILVDRRIQKLLYDHALAAGEDQAWLDTLFKGPAPIVQHARRHRDHFHVRYFDGRAQELGRRVIPMLALRPEHNVVAHRIQRGDTLGHLAIKYDSTQALIRAANKLAGSFLRAGRTLQIPLRKPCTVCPVPPEVVVPPRRLPPGAIVSEAVAEAVTATVGEEPGPAGPGARGAAFRPSPAERCSRNR